MAEREHTPTPWKASGNAVFRDGHCLAMTGTDIWMPEVEEANAAFIVRACNAHDDLVAALEAVAEARMPGEARRIARAALAKASPVEGA